MTSISAVMLFAGMCAFAAEIWVNPQVTQEPASPSTSNAPQLSGPQLFKERGCEYCHMLNGTGGRKGPNLSDVGRRLSAAAISKQIREGGGAMPAYADALDDGEITRLTQMLHEARRTK